MGQKGQRGMFKNNIIDLAKHRKGGSATSQTKSKGSASEQAPIVDITNMRKEIIQDERREVKRTILTGFIGAFVVVPNHGLLRVDVYDISENGIAFDMDTEYGQYEKHEEVAMRVYMNQNTYFPFIVNIQNIRKLDGTGMTRHGAYFVKGTVNDEALYHFVKFIETVSASLERDTGDVLVSNLKK
jgi:hypothetical protein